MLDAALVAVVGRDSGGPSGWDGVLGGGSTSDRKCLTDSLDDERARFVRSWGWAMSRGQIVHLTCRFLGRPRGRKTKDKQIYYRR